MSKGLLAFITLAFITLAWIVIIFMKQSAHNTRKKSNEIMEEFKTVDRDLQKTNERLDSLNKTDLDSLIKANK